MNAFGASVRDDDPAAVKLDVVFGDVNPKGKLPVTITEPPPSTKVLFPFGDGLRYRS